MGQKAVLRGFRRQVRAEARVMATPTVEEYALKHGRLHPHIAPVLRRFFSNKFAWASVRVEVHPREWKAFGASGRGTPTPIFVVFNTMYVVEGWLNRTGFLWGNTCDLSDASGTGWKLLVHELMHVQQYQLDGGARMVWRYLSGLVRSLVSTGGKRSWYHQSIPFEREAEAFAKRVADQIVADADDGFWRKWAEIG